MMGRLFLTVFLPFTAAFLVQELYRSVNAVIGGRVAQEVALSGTALVLVTSMYFLMFAAAQLPLGILLDRYGPRRVVAVLFVVAAGGAALFAGGQSAVTLAIGRGLIGLGMSCCLMAAFKANALWWPKERLALTNAGVLGIGSLGALLATKPTEMLLTHTDWRGLFAGLAVLTLILSAIVWGIVPHRASMQPAAADAIETRGYGQIFASPVFWKIAPIALLMQGVWLSYQGYWAGQWLADVSELSHVDVVARLTWMAVAVMVGYLTSGPIVDCLQVAGIKPARVAGIGMALFLGTQLLLALGVKGGAVLLWPAFTFFGVFSMVLYAILSQAFSPQEVGRVNSALNFLVFIAAFAIQYGVGLGINLLVNAEILPLAAAHRAALLVLVVLQAGALVRFLWPSRVAARVLAE